MASVMPVTSVIAALSLLALDEFAERLAWVAGLRGAGRDHPVRPVAGPLPDLQHAEVKRPGAQGRRRPVIRRPAGGGVLGGRRPRGTGRAIVHVGRAAVSYTPLRAHETPEQLVCRLLLEKKNYAADVDQLLGFDIPLTPRQTAILIALVDEIYARAVSSLTLAY